MAALLEPPPSDSSPSPLDDQIWGHTAYDESQVESQVTVPSTVDRPPVEAKPAAAVSKLPQKFSAMPAPATGFFSSISLVKAFTLFGFTVAAFVFVIFGLDLALAWPMQKASPMFDLIIVVCALGLALLSWDVMRDQRRE